MTSNPISDSMAEAELGVRVVWAGEGIDGIRSVQSAADVLTQFPLAASGGM